VASFAIPATVLVTVGLSEADNVLSGKPATMRPVIAGFILGIALYGISELDTRLGMLFGALIMINAVLEHGVSVFGYINGTKKGKS
jgi:hypothetical protein